MTEPRIRLTVLYHLEIFWRKKCAVSCNIAELDIQGASIMSKECLSNSLLIGTIFIPRPRFPPFLTDGNAVKGMAGNSLAGAKAGGIDVAG